MEIYVYESKGSTIQKYLKITYAEAHKRRKPHCPSTAVHRSTRSSFTKTNFPKFQLRNLLYPDVIKSN